MKTRVVASYFEAEYGEQGSAVVKIGVECYGEILTKQIKGYENAMGYLARFGFRYIDISTPERFNRYTCHVCGLPVFLIVTPSPAESSD